MITSSLFEIFQAVHDYPVDLAESGVKQNTIYHHVNKHLMTGLIAYTDPFFALVIERHKPIDAGRERYTQWEGKAAMSLRNFDDTVILSASKASLWVWWADFRSAVGSVGRIEADLMTQQELADSVLRYVNSFQRERLPTPEQPCITGNYLQIEVTNKRVFF